MAPILREVNAEYQGRVIVVYGDVGRYPKLAESFPLEVIPTQFFFTKDGKPYAPQNPQKLRMQQF
jgi:thioredoxin 1